MSITMILVSSVLFILLLNISVSFSIQVFGSPICLSAYLLVVNFVLREENNFTRVVPSWVGVRARVCMFFFFF